MHKLGFLKKNSIYCRFLKLMAAAFLAAALFFLVLNQGGTALLQSYFAKSDYMEQENQRRVEDFRSYVAENFLSVLLFIGIIMAGIRGTMKYIRSLSDEIGVRNIMDMMEEMGGKCEVTEDGEEYGVRLIFALCDKI